MKQEQVAQVSLGDLLPAALTIVTLAVATSIGAKVLDDVDNDFTADSAAANISREGSDGLLNLSEQVPLIATVVALSAVLFIVIRLVR